jgi:hypothetical protein
VFGISASCTHKIIFSSGLKCSLLYCWQVHGLEVLSTDQVEVQIQTVDPDALNFSQSILSDAPQVPHPSQTTQQLEVMNEK